MSWRTFKLVDSKLFEILRLSRLIDTIELIKVYDRKFYAIFTKHPVLFHGSIRRRLPRRHSQFSPSPESSLRQSSVTPIIGGKSLNDATVHTYTHSRHLRKNSWLRLAAAWYVSVMQQWTFCEIRKKSRNDDITSPVGDRKRAIFNRLWYCNA